MSEKVSKTLAQRELDGYEDSGRNNSKCEAQMGEKNNRGRYPCERAFLVACFWKVVLQQWEVNRVTSQTKMKLNSCLLPTSLSTLVSLHEMVESAPFSINENATIFLPGFWEI